MPAPGAQANEFVRSPATAALVSAHEAGVGRGVAGPRLSRDPATPAGAGGGHWGKDVRSDVHVAFESRDNGGIEVASQSRVESYYGSAILEQTRSVLKELGVTHARVNIHDEGALPFVITASISLY